MDVDLDQQFMINVGSSHYLSYSDTGNLQFKNSSANDKLEVSNHKFQFVLAQNGGLHINAKVGKGLVNYRLVVERPTSKDFAHHICHSVKLKKESELQQADHENSLFALREIEKR